MSPPQAGPDEPRNAAHPQIEDALVEVVEYDDGRGLLIRIFATATPVQLLRGVAGAEDVIDEPEQARRVHGTTVGRWRGLALRA